MSPIPSHPHGIHEHHSQHNNASHQQSQSQSQSLPQSQLQSQHQQQITRSPFYSGPNSQLHPNVKHIPIKSDQYSRPANDENERPSLEDESHMSVIENDENNDRRVSLKRPSEMNEIQDNKKPRLSEAQLIKPWEELDQEESNDPMMVSEYADEIFDYYHILEKRTLPDPDYLQFQRDLSPAMRSIIVDWLVEVHSKFRLLPESLLLAINIMDRFLSKELIEKNRFQLLGTASLFIAAKYEEVYSPSIKNYAYITDSAFTEDEIRQAENCLLKTLDFDISFPSPYNFLRRISKADDYDIHARAIGKFLLEISVVDHRFIGILPSECAAGAMYISRKMLGRNEWNEMLVHYSGGYQEHQLVTVCEMIISYLVGPIIHEEFFKKYSTKKFYKVALLSRQWAKKIVKEGKNIMDPNLTYLV